MCFLLEQHIFFILTILIVKILRFFHAASSCDFKETGNFYPAVFYTRTKWDLPSTYYGKLRPRGSKGDKKGFWNYDLGPLIPPTYKRVPTIIRPSRIRLGPVIWRNQSVSNVNAGEILHARVKSVPPPPREWTPVNKRNNRHGVLRFSLYNDDDDDTKIKQGPGTQTIRERLTAAPLYRGC